MLQRCCHSDWNIVSTDLPCSLSKGPLKHGFLDIYLTVFFGDGISGITSAVRVFFFDKCLKFNTDFKNAKPKFIEDFLFSDN